MQRYITFVISLLVCSVAWSQSNERDFIRMGNKYFRSGQYQKAETYYRKAIDKKPTMEGYYNLGNALAFQEQDSTAFEMYKKAVAEPSDNTLKKSHIYHNMGNLTYASALREMNTGGQNASQGFQQAVDLYKSALRLNPNDNETRYNLAMAQHQLKKSQQGGGGNNDKNKDKDKQKQEQQKQQQQQQQQQEQPQQPQAPKQPKKDEIDDKTAEQLLNSAQQDEKNVQRKVQKNPSKRKSLEKDW